MIRGVLFDMDGVLIDSERMACGLFRQLARERGYETEDGVFTQLLGIPDDENVHVLRRLLGADFPADEVMAELRRIRTGRALAGQMPVKAGMEACMQGLKARGVRIALATSTERAVLEQYLRGVPPMQGVFDAIVCGREAGRAKPAPDIYLEAARRLGLPPQACIGVEDSLTGLKSVRAAGCVAVMIPDLLPCDERFSGLTDHVLTDLGQLCALIDRLNQPSPMQGENQ